MKTLDNRTRSRPTPLRNGVAAVECAIAAPLLVLLVLGVIDVGQFANVYQKVSDASRRGARVAARYETQSTSEVQAAVKSYLEAATPEATSSTLAAATDVTVTDSAGNSIPGGNLKSLPSGSKVSVRVTLNYNAIRWIGGLKALDGGEAVATSMMRRE